MSRGKLIYDSVDKSIDLFYATKFRAPDAFIFIEKNGKKYIIASPLEIDRAKKTAEVDYVLDYAEYISKIKFAKKYSKISQIIKTVLMELKLKSVDVPESFPVKLADELRAMKFRLNVIDDPFFKGRIVKNNEEIKCIEKSQQMVFRAMKLAKDVLKKAKTKNGKLYYNNSILTSEKLRSMINLFLMENSFLASDTIVSCGKHSVYPHDIGSGPLYSGQSIIVDIFPQSLKTGYFGDATRTFCKGKAPIGLKRMYNVVKKAHGLGLKMLKAGVDGKKVHTSITNFFDKEGYPTKIENGMNVGFFHSTGHGIGLECHEGPVRINNTSFKFKTGHVTSVEPGLYYPKVGGCRVEDLVLVQKNGVKILGEISVYA